MRRQRSSFGGYRSTTAYEAQRDAAANAGRASVFQSKASGPAWLRLPLTVKKTLVIILNYITGQPLTGFPRAPRWQKKEAQHA
jgi:hypothetical protein